MNESLEIFGKKFIERVRDDGIEYWEQVFENKMKDQGSKELHRLISDFKEEDQKIIMKLLIKTIDQSLHDILWFFETSEKFSILDNETHEKLDEESDGLAGELYSEEGWIQKFSSKH